MKGRGWIALAVMVLLVFVLVLLRGSARPLERIGRR